MMKNAVAFFEQTNNSKTDRRFFYLQHSSNLLSNFNFFFSSEIDLYKKIKEKKEDKLILTSLFLSARYSPVRLISISLSYDARKNVIYYETFKNFIDSLFENETRQGFSARITLRPLNKLNFGFNGGYRYRKGDIKPSRNFGLNLSYSSIPLIETSSALSFTRLISSYIDASFYGIRMSKNIFDTGTDISVSYRKTDYSFGYQNQKLSQNIFSIDLSSPIYKFLYFSVSFEGLLNNKNTDGRILFDLTTRF
jgi:hypothetical protein